MILQSIKLTNVFSYYGEHTIDLSPKDKKRNIIILIGNNGHGKTSLLNALKIGFHGITKDLCNESQTGVNEYVLGNTEKGNQWEGLLNRIAKQEDTKHAAIEIKWFERDSGEFILNRSWKFGNDSFKDKLSLHRSFENVDYTEDEIQDIINERIPTEFSQFFFFDGEKVQKMATSSTEELQSSMEGLLKIKLFENLRDHMRAIADDYRKSAQEKGDKTIIERLDVEIEASRTQMNKLQNETRELEDDIDGLEEDLVDIKRKLMNQQRRDPRLNKEALTEKKSEIEKDLELLKERFIENLAFKLPVILNFRLKESVLRRLENEKMIAAKANYFNALLGKEDELINKVFSSGETPSPDVTVSQKRFYRDKLKTVFEELFLNEENAQTFESFFDISDPDKTERDLIMIDENEIRDQVSLIRDLSKKFNELAQIGREINDTTFLDTESQKRYQELMQKNDDINNELGAKGLSVQDKKNEFGSLKVLIDSLESDKEKKLNFVKLGERIKKHEEKARTVARAMAKFKAEVRKIKRETLERVVQEKYDMFLSDKDLARVIKISDGFELNVYDINNVEIGRASRSSGQKQMLATALLWGLAECAGQDIPTVIDTPLARLDPDNIQKILSVYYPSAGKQVIILATQTEMTDERLMLLDKNVSRVYEISNPSHYKSLVTLKEQ